MPIASNVTVSDIATEAGRTLTTAESAQVQQWITDAELLINERLGPDRMLDLSMSLYAYVVRQAVLRRLDKAMVGGASSKTVSIDDGSVTTRFDEPGGSRRWWFLDEWWELLSATTAGAFSTRPGFVPGAAGDGPDWWSGEVGNWSGPDIS